ncbi:ribonuclease H2, subunit B [Xylariales sp. PMI_506]|nr:ribonuclease H2, subunit B [Xylariales sp. PMI_506]
MARTRSKGGASTSAASGKSKSKASTESSGSRYDLSTPSSSPPKIFILPTKSTSSARVLSLLNPRYGKPTRYLVCPETGGIWEFTRVAAPQSEPKSWLVESHFSENQEAAPSEETSEDKVDDAAREDLRTGSEEDFGAYVTKGAELYIATPIDPMFLILPAFANSASVKSEKKLFLSSEDHFDNIDKSSSPHFLEVLRWEKVRRSLETRMGAICDTVDAGDESMYRFSEDKLLSELVSKAKRMSEGRLPASMEEKFVVKALDAPVLSVKREVTAAAASTSQGDQAVESGASTPKQLSDAADSQTSVASTETTVSSTSDASTAATSVAAEEDVISTENLKPSITASEEVIGLQRLRIAFSFLCSSYIAPAQASTLRSALSTSSLVNFEPLDTYLARVEQLRQEAAASRSAGDYSRKRVLDEEEAADRAEKKRKKEEEEKRKKAGESRGVRDLKKVNTTGMRKMSDFFKKK